MTWRDHTWEFTISVISWVVAIAALSGVVVFLVLEALRQRWSRGKARS